MIFVFDVHIISNWIMKILYKKQTHITYMSLFVYHYFKKYLKVVFVPQPQTFIPTLCKIITLYRYYKTYIRHGFKYRNNFFLNALKRCLFPSTKRQKAGKRLVNKVLFFKIIYETERRRIWLTVVTRRDSVTLSIFTWLGRRHPWNTRKHERVNMCRHNDRRC